MWLLATCGHDVLHFFGYLLLDSSGGGLTVDQLICHLSVFLYYTHYLPFHLRHVTHHLAHATACHHLHHLTRLVELLDETVDLLDAGA